MPDNTSILVEAGIADYGREQYDKAIEFFDTALKREPKNADALKWKISSLRGLRRFDEAEKAAEDALKLFPDNVSLLLERGFVEQSREQYEKAIEFFEAALGHEPKNAEALKWKITSLRLLGRLDEAEAAAEGALKLLPNNVSLLVERSYVENSRQEYKKAIEFFDAALMREPKNPEALKWKITSLRLLGRLDEAETATEDALKLLPNNVLLLLERGYVEYVRQKYEKAIEFFEAALQREPKNPEALRAKVSSLRGLRRFGDAATATEDALKLLPNNVSLLIERGFVEQNREQYEKASQFFEAALGHEPKNAEALKWKTTSLRLRGRLDEAAAAADDALKLLPNNVSLLIERGYVEHNRQKYEKAIEFYEAALKREPKNPEALRARVDALRLLGRLDEAEAAAEDALKLLPDNVSLLVERSYVENSRQEYKKAIGFFDAALKREPKNPEALKWKIASLRALRHFDDAKMAAEDALKLLPDNAPILVEAGIAEYGREQYEKAKEFFEVALRHEPKNADALKWRITSLRTLQRFPEAETIAEDALKLLPNNVLLLIERGYVSYDQQQFEKAMEFFAVALKHDSRNPDALRWRAASLRRLRRFMEADKEAETAIGLLPSEPTLLTERALICFDQRQYGRAIDFLNQAIAFDSKNEEAVKWKTNSLGAQQKTDDAIKFLEGLMPQFPMSVDLRVQLGWLYLDREAWDGAENVFLEAGAIVPADSPSLLGRAETFMRQNRSDEAVRLLRNRLETLPNDLNVRNTLGWIYNQRNDPLSARKEFEAVLARASKNVAALNGLGAISFAQEDYEKAEEQFREVVALQPYEPVWRGNLAWSLARQQQVESLGDESSSSRSKEKPIDRLAEAEQCCQKALELDPNYANAFGCLGVIAFKRGRLRESEDHFLQSIRASKRKGSYVDLAALYVKMARYEDAESQLKTALELDRNDVLAHIERGNLLLQNEKTKEAIREFRQATGIDPNSEGAQRALALTLIHSGKGALDEAEKILRDAIRRMDKSKRWSLHLTLGQLLEKRGDETEDQRFYVEALSEINKTVALKDDESEPHFQAGMIRNKCGEYRAAIRSFERCLRIDKNNFIAERNIERIKSGLKEEKQKVTKWTRVGGISLCIVSFAVLAVLWWGFYHPGYFPEQGKGDHITPAMLITLTPILLGLIVVSFLLPALIRLKLAGLEVELSQPKLKETLAVGPKGEVGFGTSLPNISRGPR
ncbi:MAG: hypothetical protein DME97_09340 [Verrucomicrobia bacterium]|nr:MAG: hypothetical protein DME97_09340 [Verrucomicrobiota bacterium]